MNQSDYSVVISQQITRYGEVQRPNVEALIHHEGDMEYLSNAVEIIRQSILDSGEWLSGQLIPAKGRYYSFVNKKNQDELLLFVETPVSGWNLN